MLASEASRLNSGLVQTLAQPAVMEHYRTAAIEPTPLNLDDVPSLVTERLRSVDAMRLAMFGRTR